jgi:hypothetical protein
MVLTVCLTSLLSSAVTACSWLPSCARLDTLDTSADSFSGSWGYSHWAAGGGVSMHNA